MIGIETSTGRRDALPSEQWSLPAGAVSIGGCDPPGELMPLFELVDSLTRLVTVAGITVAVLMLAYAGLVYMFGSRDRIVSAKRRVRAVVVGLLIVLSANFVVVWLVSQMGAC